LPEAEVEHRILPYQLRRRFFLTIHFNEGLQTGRFASAPEGKTFLGAPLYLYNLTLRAVSRWLTQTLREGPDGSMRRLITLAHFIGQVRGNMVGSAREKNA
jgi:hypothetical protein